MKWHVKKTKILKGKVIFQYDLSHLKLFYLAFKTISIIAGCLIFMTQMLKNLCPLVCLIVSVHTTQ